jgi:hypothetical protein
MKYTRLLVGLVVLLYLSSLVVAGNHNLNPPELTNFHQFYGQITGLSTGSYTLNAVVGEQEFTTSISSDGTYGYSPTFKLTGQDGEFITFYVVDALNIEKEVGNFVYERESVSKLDLQLPVDVPEEEGDDGLVSGGAPEEKEPAQSQPVPARSAAGVGDNQVARDSGISSGTKASTKKETSPKTTTTPTTAGKTSSPLREKTDKDDKDEGASLLYLMLGVLILLAAVIFLIFYLRGRSQE